MKGSLESPALTMDRGVIFEGTWKMENLGKGGGNPPPPGGEGKK